MSAKKKNRFQCFLSKLKYYNKTRPVSHRFGADRGVVIDRYYIEKFLFDNKDFIKGIVVEVGNCHYTRKFGGNKLKQSLVLHVDDKTNVDIVGNLETGEGIPENAVDCFILTQTLLCTFDVFSAARNAVKALKPDGVLLLTVPGITQISRFDYERWGQYWSFTDLSVKKLFESLVPPKNIVVKTYGNVKAATAFLYGLALHEVKKRDLDYVDPDYQLVIAAVVKK
jgi:hypothetical protein